MAPGGRSRTTNFDEEEPWNEMDTERLVVHVAEQVADNLWPDNLTDPWPPCPVHHDHPLQPRVARARATWLCLRDPRIGVQIGRLD